MSDNIIKFPARSDVNINKSIYVAAGLHEDDSEFPFFIQLKAYPNMPNEIELSGRFSADGIKEFIVSVNQLLIEYQEKLNEHK